MTERAANSQQTRPGPFADTLDTPLLYLSSRQAGWEDLVAEAFLEPTELQGWKPPASPYITLILFAGGPMRLDQHYEDGPRSTLVVRDGDLVLRQSMVDPYEVGWKSLSSTPTRTFHLQLNRSLLLRTAEELTGYDPARLSLARLAGFQDELLRQICLTLWVELEQSAPAGKLYAQTAAQMLAVHLLRHYTSEDIQVKEISQFLSQHQLKKVTDFISANLGRDLSLRALAEQVGFSPYHFARLFRQTTGESPHQFVLHQRIEKAKYMLRATNAPLAHIALESGFADQSHLTRSFERRLGLTPKAYRQQF